jgi:hypothetical protein
LYCLEIFEVRIYNTVNKIITVERVPWLELKEEIEMFE